MTRRGPAPEAPGRRSLHGAERGASCATNSTATRPGRHEATAPLCTGAGTDDATRHQDDVAATTKVTTCPSWCDPSGGCGPDRSVLVWPRRRRDAASTSAASPHRAHRASAGSGGRRLAELPAQATDLVSALRGEVERIHADGCGRPCRRPSSPPSGDLRLPASSTRSRRACSRVLAVVKENSKSFVR